MKIHYSTVIQERHGRLWKFFSQQAWKDGETPMTDADYLAACQKIEPTATLRIMPIKGTFPVYHAGTLDK